MRDTNASSISPGRLVVSYQSCQRTFTTQQRAVTDEEYAIEIFKLSEEYGNKSIPFDIMDIPFLKENVGLIEQEYGFPGDSVFEHLLKLDFKLLGFRSQVSAADGEQGALKSFRYAL